MKRLEALQTKRVVVLCPKAPFNFDATLHKPDHFAFADNEGIQGFAGKPCSGKERRSDLYSNIEEHKIYSKLFFGTEPDHPVSVDELLGLCVERFGEYRDLTVHYVWEDLFWQRKNQQVEWFAQLIRL